MAAALLSYFIGTTGCHARSIDCTSIDVEQGAKTMTVANFS
jgi:hypothetical protein